METPLELLKNKLSTYEILASQRGFSKVKNEARKMIPHYQNAIKALKLSQPEAIKPVCDKCEELQVELNRCYEAMDSKKAING